MNKTVALGAIAALAASPAVAEGFYAEGGYTFVSTGVEVAADGQNVSDDLNFGLLTARGGYAFTDIFAIEAEAGLGVSGEEANSSFRDNNFGFTNTTSASIDISHTLGLFARAQFPVSDDFVIFGRVGAAQVEADFAISSVDVFDDGSRASFSSDVSESETGAAFGAGAKFDVSDNLYVRGEYTRYDIENFESDALTLALGWRF